MSRSLYLGLLVILLSPAASFAQDITKILESDYEYKMISSGNNFPSVNIQTGNLGDICILLHHRIPAQDIQRHFHWSDQEFQRRIDVLLKENLIRKYEKYRYLPTFMIITLDDGDQLARSARDLVHKMTYLITRALPSIKGRYDEIEGMRGISFQDASLLIVSDVLLDNWQIRNVEARILNSERPLRNGMHYYYSIQEKRPGDPIEAFGIYGNMNSGFGSASVGIYGNQRQGLNFITIDKPQLIDWFGMGTEEDPWKFKQKLVDALIRISGHTDAALSARELKGFEKLGFVDNGKLRIPILHENDQRQLSEIAGLITNDLVALLEKQRDKLIRSYRRSSYAHEVTFQEYAIWWYHFFYTGVTDVLINQGFITKPASGVFTYLNSQ